MGAKIRRKRPHCHYFFALLCCKFFTVYFNIFETIAIYLSSCNNCITFIKDLISWFMTQLTINHVHLGSNL